MQSDEWTDPDGRSCFAAQYLPARPWTAEDKQKWQKAGAPTTVRVPTADGPGGVFLNPPKRPSKCREVGGRRFSGMTSKQVAGLPTQPGNWRTPC